MSFAFVLYLIWEAMLISYLAKRTVILPFTGLQSLLDQSDYKIAVLMDSQTEDHFRYASDSYYKRAWEERILPNRETYKSYGITTIAQRSQVSLELHNTAVFEGFIVMR